MSIKSVKRRKSCTVEDKEPSSTVSLLGANLRAAPPLSPSLLLSSKSKLSLDKLPKTALDIILSQLSTSDLLNISSLSPFLYSIAQSHLLRSIRITKDESHLNDQRYVYFQDKSLIKSARQLLQLIYTIIMNNSSGQLIDELFVESMSSKSPFYLRMFDPEGASKKIENSKTPFWKLQLSDVLDKQEVKFLSGQIPFDLSKLSLFDGFKVLLNYTSNLKSLGVFDLSLTKLQQLDNAFDNLIDVTFSVQRDDKDYVYPFTRCNNLKKLAIHYEQKTDDLLNKLALDLYEDNKLQQLESFKLAYIKVDFNEVVKTTWFSFFIGLPNEKIFTKLTDLELNSCHFDHDQLKYVNKLIQVIQFENLTSLHLGIFEYSHKSKKHSDDGLSRFEKDENFVLNLLEPYLKNLKTLTIKPTRNCFYCQFSSIIRFLNTHTGLKELSLSMNTLNKQNYLTLVNTLKLYEGLERLTLFDEFINMKLLNNMKNWFFYQNLTIFDPYQDFEIEVSKQDKNPKFNMYIVDSFNSFNGKNSNLVILFWRFFLNDFKLADLITKCHYAGSVQYFKLFGFNFRVHKSEKLIQIYINNTLGYKDLMYYI